MKVLIDTGACQGAFTESWLRKNPEGKAFCIEPSKSNAEHLRLKFQDRAVTVIQKAVWTSEGEQILWAGSSDENASITVRNEDQLSRPMGTYENVKCVTLSSFISNNTDVQSDIITLKLDVEGVEFRCLQEMLNANIVPDFLYVEDGCRKCLDISEWHARILVFNQIIRQKLDRQTFFEGDTKSSPDYLECYVSANDHAPFQIMREKSASLELVVASFKNVVEKFLSQRPDIADKIAKIRFDFTWLTCHSFTAVLDSGENIIVHSPDPLNSTKDVDLVDRFLSYIEFQIDSQTKEFQIGVSFKTLEECQSNLNNIMSTLGREEFL